MQKLELEYDDKRGEYRGEYRGLTIQAVQDSDASNPWQDCDGFAPLLWTSGEGWQDESGRYDIESPFADKSPAWISRNWRKACAVLELDADSEAAELVETQREESPRWRSKLGEMKRERLAEALADLKPSRDFWRDGVEYLDALEALHGLAGTPALAFQRNGYSQGDSVLGLLVAPKAWRDAMGIKLKRGEDMAEDLESQANVFGYWAFGDVYGYAIEGEDGETLDSCFGYYGSDFEESGLAEAAQEMADSILAEAAKRRCGRLAELIRNRVPLHARPPILAEAGRLQSAFG